MKTDNVFLFRGLQKDAHSVEGSNRYIEIFDNDESGICHQMKLELFATVPFVDLKPKIQKLLRLRFAITKFKHLIRDIELDLLINRRVIFRKNTYHGGEQIEVEQVPVEVIN